MEFPSDAEKSDPDPRWATGLGPLPLVRAGHRNPRAALWSPRFLDCSPAPRALHQAPPTYPPFPSPRPHPAGVSKPSQRSRATRSDFLPSAPLRSLHWSPGSPTPSASSGFTPWIPSGPVASHLPLTLLPSPRVSAGSPGAKHSVLHHNPCPLGMSAFLEALPPPPFRDALSSLRLLHVFLPSPTFMSVHPALGSLLFALTSSSSDSLAAGGSPHPHPRFGALGFLLKSCSSP